MPPEPLAPPEPSGGVTITPVAVLSDAHRRFRAHALFLHELVRRIKFDAHVDGGSGAETVVSLGLREVVAVARLHLTTVDPDVLVPEQLVGARGVHAHLGARCAFVAAQADDAHAHPVALGQIVAVQIEVSVRVDLAPAEQIEIAVRVDVAERKAVVDRRFRGVLDAPVVVHVLELAAAEAAQDVQVVATVEHDVRRAVVVEIRDDAEAPGRIAGLAGDPADRVCELLKMSRAVVQEDQRRKAFVFDRDEVGVAVVVEIPDALQREIVGGKADVRRHVHELQIPVLAVHVGVPGLIAVVAPARDPILVTVPVEVDGDRVHVA